MIVLATGLLAAVVGLAIGLRWGRGHGARERARLLEELSSERAQARAQDDRFARLSQEALAQNRSAFLDLATEKLKEFKLTADHALGMRETAVEGLVKPIREALDKTEQHLREVERARSAAFAGLSQELRMLGETQRLLQSETRALGQALRQPQVRGRWGELTLRRLAELAGMVDHCDFFEQETVRDADQSLLRPDVIIRLPEDRVIVIDAKTPLDAYLRAVEASDDSQRALALRQHAEAVRSHVRRLAAKSYWNQFPNSPEFVVLFIPGDQFLAPALELDPALLEDALTQQVILATPTSLVALLRAVAFGWRQRALEQNAEEIRRVGEDLYARLAVFAQHLGGIGKGLDGGVEAYNRAVGSFERMVMPAARRFTELGVSAKKTLTPPDLIDSGPRRVLSETPLPPTDPSPP